MNEFVGYFKTTLIILLILILLYILKVPAVVSAFDWFVVFWNNSVIYITTFKDRHPMIMLFMPLAVIILLATMKGDPDFAEL